MHHKYIISQLKYKKENNIRVLQFEVVEEYLYGKYDMQNIIDARSNKL